MDHGLRSVRNYIPRLEQDLELLRAKAESKAGSETKAAEENQLIGMDAVTSGGLSYLESERPDKLGEIMVGNDESQEDDNPLMDSGMVSDSEALSDIFETDSDTDDENAEQPLYLNELKKFPVQSDGDPEDFAEHLRQISADSKTAKSLGKDVELPDFDEVDRMFLQAASLLKKKKR